MQCSQLAVKMRLFRARRELKKILKKLVSAIELPCGKKRFLGDRMARGRKVMKKRDHIESKLLAAARLYAAR
jgi:hypothetical protein